MQDIVQSVNGSCEIEISDRCPNSCEFSYGRESSHARLVFVFELGFYFRFGILVDNDFVGLELVGVAGQFLVPFLFEVIIEVVVKIVCVKIVEWIGRHCAPPSYLGCSQRRI